MLDTLDLIVVGCKRGRYFALACYDEAHDKFITIAMIDRPKSFMVNVKKDHRIVCAYDVDDFFYPELVVEISYDRIEACASTMSPFFIVNPKFKKIRWDKKVYDATALKEIDRRYR